MQLTKEEILELWRRGFVSPLFFCQFYLAKWFPSPMVWAHRGLLAILTRRTDFLLEFGEEEWVTRRGKVIHFQWTPAMLDKIVRHFTFRMDPEDPESLELPLFRVEFNTAGAPIAVHLTVAENTLVMMPRGFSKTTIANAAVLWRVVYKESLFPCYVGETQTHAETQLGNVKTQLETNERLRLVFGALRPDQRSGKRWAQDVIQLTNDVTVAARSRGGQVRGMNVDAQRPDWIVLDDVEDKESVATSDQRSKTENWFLGDLLPATGEMDEGEYGSEGTEVSIVMLATLLHREALAQKNRNSPEFTSIVLAAIDKDGDPLWPAKMGLDKLEKKKLIYVRRGKLNLFYLEYFNQIRVEESQSFKSTYFIHRPYSIEDCSHRALMVDPAISEKKDADSCVFGVVGIMDRGQLIVYHCDGAQAMSPREQVNEYFRLHKQFHPTKCGIETIAYQKALLHLMREEMFRRGEYFEITPIGHHKLDKETRITGILQPRYASGYIHHVKSFPLLESQLLDFPAGHDDYPDVIAMAIALLDPYAALAAPGEGEDGDLTKDKFEPLELVWAAP